MMASTLEDLSINSAGNTKQLSDKQVHSPTQGNVSLQLSYT